MTGFHVAQVNAGAVGPPADMRREPYCVGWS
jgi:hypothetical protein